VDVVFPIPKPINGNSPLADDEPAPVDATLQPEQLPAKSHQSSLISAEVASKAATEVETIAVLWQLSPSVVTVENNA
jgi:hypothetical protein